MAIICPTITADSQEEYVHQINNVTAFASRIHIDLMDGQFAPSLSPPIEKIWLPQNILSDIHLMYEKPMDYIERLAALRPNMVIIHLEADVDHRQFANFLRGDGIKAGLALLQDSKVESAAALIPFFDQILIFSGKLGYHGGQADMSLSSKIEQIRAVNKNVEIAWDGGLNDQNSPVLAAEGVEVLNVGGFIADSPDPKAAYDKLEASLEVKQI